jgi:hypothetical protein
VLIAMPCIDSIFIFYHLQIEVGPWIAVAARGCESQHVIADNLGWTDYKVRIPKGETNIEEYFATEACDNVSRVSPWLSPSKRPLFHDSKSDPL